MTIILPLPPKELAPNYRSRSHWPKTKALKKARNDAFICALKGVDRRRKAPRWKHAVTQAIFYFDTNRRRDGDNLAAMLKPYWDGLVDAGIIWNDSGCTHMPVQVYIDKANPRVELTVIEKP